MTGGTSGQAVIEGHVIRDGAAASVGYARLLNADGEFLRHLHALGREQAQAWIDRHFDDLGARSTVDIQAVYL